MFRVGGIEEAGFDEGVLIEREGGGIDFFADGGHKDIRFFRFGSFEGIGEGEEEFIGRLGELGFEVGLEGFRVVVEEVAEGDFVLEEVVVEAAFLEGLEF